MNHLLHFLQTVFSKKRMAFKCSTPPRRHSKMLLLVRRPKIRFPSYECKNCSARRFHSMHGVIIARLFTHKCLAHRERPAGQLNAFPPSSYLPRKQLRGFHRTTLIPTHALHLKGAKEFHPHMRWRLKKAILKNVLVLFLLLLLLLLPGSCAPMTVGGW